MGKYSFAFIDIWIISWRHFVPYLFSRALVDNSTNTVLCEKKNPSKSHGPIPKLNRFEKSTDAQTSWRQRVRPLNSSRLVTCHCHRFPRELFQQLPNILAENSCLRTINLREQCNWVVGSRRRKCWFWKDFSNVGGSVDKRKKVWDIIYQIKTGNDSQLSLKKRSV